MDKKTGEVTFDPANKVPPAAEMPFHWKKGFLRQPVRALMLVRLPKELQVDQKADNCVTWKDNGRGGDWFVAP